ncbi:hypothetical protein BaRGS_00005857 [Batillaria attramentaria]|uniref:Uncharacterized protein n=1 Tax=Batillaria attramentaria TaxID=370345 RepID=A0ABD0LUX5_9CAEN
MSGAASWRLKMGITRFHHNCTAWRPRNRLHSSSERKQQQLHHKRLPSVTEWSHTTNYYPDFKQQLLDTSSCASNVHWEHSSVRLFMCSSTTVSAQLPPASVMLPNR